MAISFRSIFHEETRSNTRLKISFRVVIIIRIVSHRFSIDSHYNRVSFIIEVRLNEKKHCEPDFHVHISLIRQNHRGVSCDRRCSRSWRARRNASRIREKKRWHFYFCKIARVEFLMSWTSCNTVFFYARKKKDPWPIVQALARRKDV